MESYIPSTAPLQYYKITNEGLGILKDLNELDEMNAASTVFINLLKPTHGLNEPTPTAQGARKAVERFPESSRDSCPVYHQGEPRRSN